MSRRMRWVMWVVLVWASPAAAQWVEDEEPAPATPSAPARPPQRAPTPAPVPPPVGPAAPVPPPVYSAPPAAAPAPPPPTTATGVPGERPRAQEVWSDEDPPPPTVFPRQPSLGVTGGLHLGMSGRGAEGPTFGGRAGVRFGLVKNLALSLYTSWEFESVQTFNFPSVEPVPALQHAVLGVARLELVSVSVFRGLLVPELTLGVLAGGGILFPPSVSALPTFTVGLHLGMTRLRPSAWWFPVFVEAAWESGGGPGSFRFCVGVGF